MWLADPKMKPLTLRPRRERTITSCTATILTAKEAYHRSYLNSLSVPNLYPQSLFFKQRGELTLNVKVTVQSVTVQYCCPLGSESVLFQL
jgi:hypothetical protein